MDKNALVSQYESQIALADRLEAEYLSAQNEARVTLEQIQNEYGKGPYSVNGKEIVVLRRRGTMCTMPATRVRKNKRNAVADVSATGTSVPVVESVANGYANYGLTNIIQIPIVDGATYQIAE